MLFNEPKLLKSREVSHTPGRSQSFSALQRAEIAEISKTTADARRDEGFSALQRAEIAEIFAENPANFPLDKVSVLFNEPKLLKYSRDVINNHTHKGFSALQRAEIAEIPAGC